MKEVSDVLYGTYVSNEGVRALVQSLMRGRMTEPDALAIIEYAPRLAECLMDGLSGMFGKVTPRRFVDLARSGDLNGGALSRALAT